MDKVTAASSICFTWVIQKCDVENVQAISTRTFQCLCAKALNRQHLPSASARHGNTPLTCRVTTEYDGRGATDWNDGPVVAPMGTCTAVQLEKVSSGSRHCPWLRPTWILPEIIQNCSQKLHRKWCHAHDCFRVMSVWWPCDFRIEFIPIQTVTIGGSWYIRCIRMFSVRRESKRVLQL